MQKFSPKRRFYVAPALAVCFLLAALFPPAPARAAEPQGGYSRSFGTADFRTNQDALKYEIPENGRYKIIPRSRNSTVSTRFPIPDNAWGYREWIVTAKVSSAEGAGAGVEVRNDEGGYALLLFPDGSGSMRYYAGKSAVWAAEIKVAGFSLPARISLTRDVNGSMLGKVNDVIVAARILPLDLKNIDPPPIKSVAFCTSSPAGRGSAEAVYEGLDVQAWGVKTNRSLFEAPSAPAAE
ncbi:MAG: hypothetical protein LBS93_05035 [Synergistaceae bacterium]|nr:hypothetical protein [Synergistaceae bacterium]